jgi:hypothetical protein
MAIKTWFTQPTNSFSSFYYYDDSNKKLVRIRLELNRKQKEKHNENPIISVNSNRYVGFIDAKSNKVDYSQPSKWSVNAGVISYNNTQPIVLGITPTIGYRTYDFSLNSGNLHPTHVHKGTIVTISPNLPPDITEDILQKIAEDYIVKEDCIYNIGKTTSNSSSEELAREIQRLYTK